MRLLRPLLCALMLALSLAPIAVRADADEHVDTPQTLAQGLQPLRGPIPVTTPAPGESRIVPRGDGSFQAVPEVRGRTKIFHISERQAPWTLRPGLTVMARTYNGVVPGPVVQVNQGDSVVIDYRNESDMGDTIHLHGIRSTGVDMDGVPGISQPLVQPGGHYRYEFVANQPGTFIYHTHGTEAMLESGLYGAIVVLPSHPSQVERNVAHDYVEMVSSWMIQSASENHFTLNGKEYPATTQLQVRKGDRVRIRWISMSGEEWHTMHTHGHDQRVIARDARPMPGDDEEDTVALGPGQRADVIVTANAKPGTWLIHCHVADHVEGADSMPDGLITAFHYEGTPNTFASMQRAMTPMMTATGPAPLSVQKTLLLGAIAGFTIFLGLPVARARRLSPHVIALLNAVAIGILVFLVVEIAQNATIPLTQAMAVWHAGQGAFPGWLVLAYVGGFLLGLVGLGSASMQFMKRHVHDAGEHPYALSAVIALGIGAHNFGEGLAIGASAATGATALAIGLIIGFALHNATEGFGIAAPMAGRMVPSWAQIGLAGLIAGGPTFLGTVVGYFFTSPILSVFFLTIAAGALVFVIGEMWSVLKRIGMTSAVTTALACGFFVALATEMIVDLSGG
ncbi:MAG: multicopper oxidase domain-containing protein [Candidatus Eremiobacteraeota bacterium]|nr:multicopper oxidase domain-containing protein [Candidatus Eremiobacteraeota bacterium]